MQRLFYVLLLASFRLPSSSCYHRRVDQVFNALEKVLNYVEANSKLMNVDAVFGLILGQAHLIHINGYKDLPRKEFNRTLEILIKLNGIIDETKNNLKDNQKNLIYLKTVLNVENWLKNITFNNRLKTNSRFYLNSINTYKTYLKYLTQSTFNEHKSDDCIKNLLLNCFISSECYKTMRLNSNSRFDPAYGVTHSLLFLQLAKSQKCKLNETQLKKKIINYCSYINWELRQNVEYGFLSSLDDLLLEQITLCGYEGFADFLTEDLIEHVLSIQQPSGCFTIDFETLNGSRIKRESNVITENCIDHTTGLGVSVLSLFLRYLLTK